MPIYEYKCRQCGHRFERLEKSFDPDAPTCPGCGTADVEKQMSAFSAQVKPGQSARCQSCTDAKCPYSSPK